MSYLDRSSAFTPSSPFTPVSPTIYEGPDRWERSSLPQGHLFFTESGATTDRLASPALDLLQQYQRDHSARVETFIKNYRGIAARIGDLITDAAMMNEPVSTASLKDLMAFLNSTPFNRRPAVYLLDNGNFRLVWKGTNKEQAAFQFRGNEVVHCVFFFKRAKTQFPLSLETIIDLLPNIRDKYKNYAHLLNASTT